MLFLMLIIFGNPCDTPCDNRMLLFNESMVMLYLYLLIGVSDYNLSSDVIDPLGIGLLGIVMLAFIVNFMMFLVCFY